MWMNHISLKQKILIIFIVCVLIPMIATNGYVFLTMDNSRQKDWERNIENTADRIEYEIKDNVNKQLLIADYLNMNTMLNEFLDYQYKDNEEYYEAYLKLMQDETIRHYYTVQSVYSITICTDNPTIVNGNFFVRKDVVQDCEWYQTYKQNGKRIFSYAFYEDGVESGGYLDRGRKLVIMRKLDNCESDSILILEFDYEKILEKLKLECEEVNGYLIGNNKILCSSLESNNKDQDFKPAIDYNKKEYSYTRTVELYGNDIEIRLTAQRPSIFGMLKENIGHLLILYFMNLLLPTALIYIVYRSFSDRIALTQVYLDKLKEGEYEEIPCDEGSDEIGSMIRSYNLMVRRIKELIEVVFTNKVHEQDLEIARKQAELNALQSQLNPHFIFNALESIRMHSVLKQEKETAKILESFAVLMRKNIQWDKDFVTIEEESENVRRYLEIQKYRFGERLEFSMHIQESCLKYRIPKFVLITFVENACVHGIEESVDGGSITVMVSEDDQKLYLEILDSGSGMESTELARLRAIIEYADIDDIRRTNKSIGIINAVVRMKQYYGDGVQIDINSSVGGGTEVYICMQKQPKEF